MWAVLSLLLVFAFPTFVAAGENLKVGVLDIQRVLSRSIAGKRAAEKFQAEVKNAEAELLKEKQALERLKSDLDKQGLLLREEERMRLEKDFQRRYRDYVRGMRDSEEELRQREAEMTAKIVEAVHGIVAALGEQEGLALVLERSRVLYGSEQVDVTEKVIELYDQQVQGKAATKK